MGAGACPAGPGPARGEEGEGSGWAAPPRKVSSGASLRGETVEGGRGRSPASPPPRPFPGAGEPVPLPRVFSGDRRDGAQCLGVVLCAPVEPFALKALGEFRQTRALPCGCFLLLLRFSYYSVRFCLCKRGASTFGERKGQFSLSV